MVSTIGSVLFYGSLVFPVLVFSLVFLKFEREIAWKSILISTSFSLATFALLMGFSIALLFGSGPIAVGATPNTGIDLLRESYPGLVLTLVIAVILALPGYMVCKSRRAESAVRGQA